MTFKCSCLKLELLLQYVGIENILEFFHLIK